MFYNAFTPHYITHQVNYFSDELTRVYDPKDLWKLMVECQCLCDRNKAILLMVFFFFILRWVHTVQFFTSLQQLFARLYDVSPVRLKSKVDYATSNIFTPRPCQFLCEIEVKPNNPKHLLALTCNCFAKGKKKDNNNNSGVVDGKRDHGLLITVSVVLSYGNVMLNK